MSCDDVYSAYGGRNVASSTISGVMSGIGGMIGFGGFWDPVSDTALENVVSDFNRIKADWDATLQTDENKLVNSQREFADRQQQLIETTQNFKDEIMDEKITKNTLFIQILFGIVLIIIIYLMVL